MGAASCDTRPLYSIANAENLCKFKNPPITGEMHATDKEILPLNCIEGASHAMRGRPLLPYATLPVCSSSTLCNAAIDALWQ